MERRKPARVEEEKEHHPSERILRKAEEGRAVGISSLQQLKEQGEQLKRAEKNVDRANENLDNATWLIRGMQSYTGAVLNYFSAPPSSSSETNDSVDSISSLSADEGWEFVDPQDDEDDEEGGSNSNSNLRRQGGQKREKWQEQLQQDKNLSRIAFIVDQLKDISQETSAELAKQNEQLDRLHHKTDALTERTKRTNDRLKKW
jgi:HPt (histidine-containing phosphotransfer) domain-containing protein